MNAPSGGVTARTATKKRRIWIQPLAVKGVAPVSEALGLQQRVREVREQGERQQQSDDVLGSHGHLTERASAPANSPARTATTSVEAPRAARISRTAERRLTARLPQTRSQART